VPVPLYSARLVAGPLAAGSRVEYTADVGVLQVVRDVSLVAVGGSGDAFLWGLVLDSADVPVGGDSTAHSGDSFSYHWVGRLVLNHGDVLYVATSAGLSADFAISGYIFDS
jgi:hypothetical protein